MVKYFLYALVSFCVFISCEKDKDLIDLQTGKDDSSESDIEEKSYRIKQIVEEGGSRINHFKFDFVYEDDKLLETMVYEDGGDGSWDWQCERNFTYSGDIVSYINSHVEQANFRFIYDKEDVHFQNGRIVEKYSVSEGMWSAMHKRTYKYSGDDLKSWKKFHANDENGEYELFESGEYIFQDDEIIEYKEFDYDEEGNGIQVEKIKYYNEGGVRVGSVGYEGNEIDGWKKSDSILYFFDEGYISQIDCYYWNEIFENWPIQPYSKFYSYDNGNLEKITNSNGMNVHFEYEEGKGNTDLFFNWMQFW